MDYGEINEEPRLIGLTTDFEETRDIED